MASVGPLGFSEVYVGARFFELSKNILDNQPFREALISLNRAMQSNTPLRVYTKTCLNLIFRNSISAALQGRCVFDIV
jgi:hypothetical protein